MGGLDVEHISISRLVLLCFLMLAVITIGMSSVVLAEEVQGMALGAENEYLQLYINLETADIAVKDKRIDTVWYSSPPNSNNKQQITIVYADDDRERTMNSYTDSVLLDQFEIDFLDNGLKITYILGQVWQERDYIPNMISKERFDELVLNKISEEDAASILEYFNLISLVLPDYERPSLGGIDLNKILGDYTVVSYTYEQQRAYFAQLNDELDYLKTFEATDESDDRISELKREIRSLERKVVRLPDEQTLIRNLLMRVQDQREDIVQFADLKLKDFEQLYYNPTYVYEGASTWREEELVNILKRVGYTPEDKQIDHLFNNIAPPSQNCQVFKIVIEYILDGEHLVVRIPGSDIEYPEDEPTELLLDSNGEIVLDDQGLPVYDPDGNLVSYPLLSIRVLEYFGAVGDSEGYLVVPDGSGTIIDLKNTGVVRNFRTKIYGRDRAVAPLEKMTLYTESSRLPLFGLTYDNKALLAIIEEGDAIAEVAARSMGPPGTYNQIYSQYTMMPKSVITLADAPRMPTTVETSMSAVSTVTAYQSGIYQGDLIIRYAFLYDEQANYVGMANYYRDYLINRYSLEAKPASETSPFILELLGAVTLTKPVFGFPVNVTQPLTTFEEAQKIIRDLENRGVSNFQVRYTGWLKEGLRHILPNRAPIEKAVGDKEQLAELNQFLQQRDSYLFLDVNFTNIGKEKLGFSAPGTYAAKYLSGQPAFVYEYDVATQLKKDELAMYIIRPEKIPNLVSGFLKDFREYGVNGLSLNQMGYQINADYDTKGLIDRQVACDIVTTELGKLTQQGYSLMVSGGNAYTLPYASTIVDIPMDSSSYFIEERSIPLLQIALRGLVDYAGPAINLAEDRNFTILKTVETGGANYYVFSYEDSSFVKGTMLNHLYSIGYRNWLDFVADLYTELKPVMDAIGSSPIVGHEQILDNVYQTTFSNQTKVVVNYNHYDVEVDGNVIDAESYRLFLEGVKK